MFLFWLADVRDDENESPLDIAIKSKEIEAAHYLVNHGAGASKHNARLLFRACKEGELDVVKELIEKYKLDPNCKYITRLDINGFAVCNMNNAINAP